MQGVGEYIMHVILAIVIFSNKYIHILQQSLLSISFSLLANHL